jgi:hypothetical protein
MLVEERTTVGLDVHARSVVAEAVDWSSGDTFSRWLTPAPAEVLGGGVGLGVAAAWDGGGHV